MLRRHLIALGPIAAVAYNPVAKLAELLFREINTPGTTSGGRYKGTPYFNGGIFDTIAPFDLTGVELAARREAATTTGSAVRPETTEVRVLG